MMNRSSGEATGKKTLSEKNRTNQTSLCARLTSLPGSMMK